MIFPLEQTLKNSPPTSAAFFAGWLSRRVMARRENNFWRFAESQCELGLQDLRTRITKRITRVAPGASSPDVHLTSCRVLLSLSGQHAADTRTRQRVFWRATSLTPLESPSRDDLANLFHFGFHRLAIAVAFYESFQFASVFLSQRLRLKCATTMTTGSFSSLQEV